MIRRLLKEIYENYCAKNVDNYRYENIRKYFPFVLKSFNFVGQLQQVLMIADYIAPSKSEILGI